MKVLNNKHKNCYYPNNTQNSKIFKTNSITNTEIPKNSSSQCKNFTIAASLLTALCIGTDFLFCKGKHSKKLLNKLKNSELFSKLKKAIQSADIKKSSKNLSDKTSKSNNAKIITKNIDNPIIQTKPQPNNATANLPTANTRTTNNTDNKIFKTDKQLKFEEECKMSQKFVKEHMDELESFLIDEKGCLDTIDANGSATKIALNELYKPYKGDIKIFYHGTDKESKIKILKEGFSQQIAPKHGHLDGIGGTYFSTKPTKEYGEDIIKAKFSGKIAETNTDLLNNIKISTFNQFSIESLLQRYGISTQHSEAVIREFLKEKLIQQGYQGIIGTNMSTMAGCRYFAAIDPSLIKIIE